MLRDVSGAFSLLTAAQHARRNGQHHQTVQKGADGQDGGLRHFIHIFALQQPPRNSFPHTYPTPRTIRTILDIDSRTFDHRSRGFSI